MEGAANNGGGRLVLISGAAEFSLIVGCVLLLFYSSVRLRGKLRGEFVRWRGGGGCGS